MSATAPVLDLVERLGGPAPRLAPPPSFLVVEATAAGRRAHRALRRRAFVEEQGLFASDDADDADAVARVLVARAPGGAVLGGVRLHPEGDDPTLGWWRGSRLVAVGAPGVSRGLVGARLVTAACARAVAEGALRFDAHVQPGQETFFARLGWQRVCRLDVAGRPHLLMRWPIARFAELARAMKAPLGALVGGLVGAGPWRGDDGAPVPRSDLVACTDAIVPAMVERDPEWAGWCAMLVTAHDLGAMGAAPLGALDALGAADAGAAARILDGVRRGAAAFDLPVLGGHTQLGVPAALSVTGLGHAAAPVPAGGGRAGDRLTLTADLDGGWRPGYSGRQWDSSSGRGHDELRAMLDAVGHARPRAAKDVSMAGFVGTVGMLAEASGTGAELDVDRIVRPTGVAAADWLTCFPGFAMVTADAPGAAPLPAGPATGAPCGHLETTPGVRLRWPDGAVTEAFPAGVSGLGPAHPDPEILPCPS